MTVFVRVCPRCGTHIDDVRAERVGVARLARGRRVYAEWSRRDLVQVAVWDKFEDESWRVLKWREVASSENVTADFLCASCEKGRATFDAIFPKS